MTDQDNLQNRIEEILHQVGNRELALNMSPNERNELAQAIIDEFGLTVEHSMVGHEVHEDGSWTTWPSQSRVVGTWE